MELLKLLLRIGLIFIAVKTTTGIYKYRIDRSGMQLIRHDINLYLAPNMNKDDYENVIDKYFKSYIDEQRAKGNFIFYGESIMWFHDDNEIPNINLHVLNIQIDVNTSKIVFTINDTDNEICLFPDHIPDVQMLNIKVEKKVVIHTYHLIIKFIGIITDNTGGFHKTIYTNAKEEKKWLIVAANFRGAGARQIFPCWDEPDIRTNFTISIKHHRNFTAISNTPIDMEFIDNDIVWTRFKTTDKISPYHVAIVLSDLYRIPNTNVRCRQIVKQQIKFAHAIANNATFYLKHIFNNAKFPSKVDYVVIPNFRNEGLESWGLVLYKEEAVIYDKKEDFVAWKFEVARMVARKMVYQFFGNLVGQTWWSYLWLNEGIATFLAMEIIKEYVHSHLMDLLVVQFQHESLRLNDYYDMPLVSEVITPSDIDSLFSFTYHVKAPVFIRTLLQIIPIDTFKIALNRYLTTYQLQSIDNSSSTTDKFFNVLQEVAEELNKFYMNLTRRLDPWTTQKRYPVLHVTQNSDKSEIRISLLQNYIHESYPKKMFIPVTYTTQRTFNVTKKRWLSPDKPILQLTNINKDGWIIVNVQQAGYYRVNYDKNNWQKLVDYLKSKKYLNIHVLNRAQIIDDAYYFLLNNKLDSHIFKNLTYYLLNEKNYVAWYPMFKIMEEISTIFPFPESTEVKDHFKKILDSILGDIAYTVIGDESNQDALKLCLRQEAAKWACVLDSWFCMQSALFKFKQRQKQPISPGWKEWTYCKGLMLVEYDFWLEVLDIERDNNILKFLACTKNSSIIRYYLDMIPNFLEVQDRIIAFHSIIARHAKSDLVLNYILNNFEYVVPKEISMITALIDIINHLYTKDQIMKINKFTENTFSSILFSTFNQDVRIKTEQRWAEINKHKNYFKNFLKAK